MSTGRGSETITLWESPTPICLFTIQLLLGSDGSFALESSNIKAVFGQKIGFVEMEPIKDSFQENGGIDFRYWFRDLTYFASKSVHAFRR